MQLTMMMLPVLNLKRLCYEQKRAGLRFCSFFSLFMLSGCSVLPRHVAAELTPTTATAENHYAAKVLSK